MDDPVRLHPDHPAPPLCPLPVSPCHQPFGSAGLDCVPLPGPPGSGVVWGTFHFNHPNPVPNAPGSENRKSSSFLYAAPLLREKVCVRGIFWTFLLLLFWLPTALSPSARAAEPSPNAQPAPVSVEELERLVHTLQDDAARTRLVEQLRALIAVKRGAEAERPAAAALFGQLSQQIDAFSGEILAGVAMVLDAPRLIGWAREQMSDTAARRLWGEAALSFGLIFGFAVIAEWIVRWTLSRLSLRLPARRRDTRFIRACFALLGLVLDLLPILVFAGTAFAALSIALDPLTRPRITLSILVNATVEARLLLCVARAVLLPADAGRRVCTDRCRDPELSLHLGQAVHFLGDFWLRGSDRRVVARRSRGALRVDAEGGRFGTGSPRYHLPLAESGDSRRMDHRRDVGELPAGPGSAVALARFGISWPSSTLSASTLFTRCASRAVSHTSCVPRR